MTRVRISAANSPAQVTRRRRIGFNCLCPLLLMKPNYTPAGGGDQVWNPSAVNYQDKTTERDKRFPSRLVTARACRGGALRENLQVFFGDGRALGPPDGLDTGLN